MNKYYTTQFKGLTSLQLSQKVNNYFKENLAGTTIINQQKTIAIIVNKITKRKAVRYNLNAEKALLIVDLKRVLRQCLINNFGLPKENHIRDHKAIGFINFIYKCKIDNKSKSYRICVMIKHNGKFHYDLHENLPKKKNLVTSTRTK
jgi:hypothetical protein